MNIYGYNIVTTLPISPRVGQEVFLSPDGLTGTLQYYNGTVWVAVVNTDSQTLSIVGDSLTIAGGNTITLPAAPTPPIFGWRSVTASTTIAGGDVANGVALDSAVTSTVTVPNNATTPIAVGSSVLVTADGTGVLSLVAGAGVDLRVAAGLSLSLNGQYSVVTLIKRATDTWYIAGDLATA